MTDELISELLASGDSFGLSSLSDDTLSEVKSRALRLVQEARREESERRRSAVDRRAVERLTNRASCVFCRRVFTAEGMAGHLQGMHSRDLLARFGSGRRSRRHVAA